jgi:glycerate kinase
VVGEAGGERVAVIEMAEASGMWRVAGDERAILRSDTFGTGLLMRHAVNESRAERLIIGLGGSATNDGGAGMATALGVRFLDASGAELDPHPAAWLGRLAKVDVSARMSLPPVTAACDVDNPLLGAAGASRVFGPQKGAGPDDIPRLEQALEELARCSGRPELARLPGAGAAGGLGFGLMAFADGRLSPGFDLVASLTGLEERIAAADMVVTGEGSLDLQSLGGKGPVALARLARRHGKRVVAFCGRADEAIRAAACFDAIHALSDTGLPENELMPRAAELLEQLARRESAKWNFRR